MAPEDPKSANQDPTASRLSANDSQGRASEEAFAPLARANRAHSLIVGNVVTELNIALRDGPCEVYPPAMRVRSEETGFCTYPDVAVTFGEAHFLDEACDTLTNPQLIVEVLSDSTETHDRGKKFDHYRSIASVRDYILVAQTEVLVEHFTRHGDGTWLLRVLRADDILHIKGISCKLPIRAFYRKVADIPAETA